MRAYKLNKYISLTILAVLALSIVPIMAPATTVAQSLSVTEIKASRTTAYYNQTFYVDVSIWTDSTAPDNLTIAMKYSGTGYTYQLNATRIGTTMTYRVWFEINGSGYLTVYESNSDGSESSTTETVNPAITLSDGDVLTFIAGDKSLNITFEHTEPSAVSTSLPEELIMPLVLNNSGTYTPTRDTTGWLISAPDLNKNPTTLDNYTVEVTISSENFDLGHNVTVKINETEPNSGVFNITENIFGKLSNDELGNLSTNVTAGDNLTFTFYLPKSYENSELDVLTITLPVKAAPTIAITTDRDEIPLSSKNMSLYIEVTDSGTTSASIELTIYNISGINVTAPETITLNQIDQSTFAKWIWVNTSLLGPDCINGWVLLSYTGSDGNTYTKKLPLKIYPASLSINGSASVTAKYGDELVFKLYDPEQNINASAVDTVTLNIGSYTLTLKETGDNTGTFEGTAILADDGNFTGSPGDTLTVSYTDDRSPSTTPDMTSFISDSLSAEVTIEQFTGSITTDKTSYGPFDTITITITDPDMNTHYMSKDTIPAGQIFIKNANGDWVNPPSDAVETGDNTGVFELEIPVSFLGSPSDVLLMKSTQIIYKDLHTPSGITLLSTSINFVSWDAQITTDKQYYNLGEKIKINVTDPDANEDPNTIDILTDRLVVTSTSDPTGVKVTLVETGPNTGVFTAEILVTDHAIGSGYILAHMGDQINISYTDEYPANYDGHPKTFTKTVMVGVPITEPIKPSTVEFVNPMTGASITPKVGKTVGIGVTVNNTAYMSEKFTVLMIIRDSSGAAIAIQWQTITLPAGTSGEVGFTFTPSAAGSYTVEIHLIKSLADWTVMGQTLTSTMNVTQ